MNLQKMMKQAQEMQNKMAEVQSKVDATEMEGTAGGGAVSILLSGKNKLLKVAIDDSLLKPEEKEVLEDLIIAAYSDARAKLDEQFTSDMEALTSGLNLPPGMKLPF
jgi:DNA-binding YbaB/EbfC family protein